MAFGRRPSRQVSALTDLLRSIRRWRLWTACQADRGGTAPPAECRRIWPRGWPDMCWKRCNGRVGFTTLRVMPCRLKSLPTPRGA